MKKILMLTLCTTLFFGCGDPCDDVECLNNGVCIEGTCDCTEGYEGLNCENEIREPFIGRWATEMFNCDGDIFPTAIILSRSPDSVLELNFQEEGNSLFIIKCVLNSTGFEIPRQVVDVFFIEGSAVLNGDVLTLNFTINGELCMGDLRM